MILRLNLFWFYLIDSTLLIDWVVFRINSMIMEILILIDWIIDYSLFRFIFHSFNNFFYNYFVQSKLYNRG
jgi:hypothetical protein